MSHSDHMIEDVSSPRPNVLIIGHDLPHVGAAGSILLHRLFRDWPESALLSLGPSPPAGVVCRGGFIPYDPPLERWVRSRFFKLVRLLRSFGLCQSGNVKNVVPAGFKPDVVVHVLSSLGYSESAFHYARRSGVPLVLIVHDDPEDFNETYSWAARFIRRRFRVIYQQSSHRLCVSPEMDAMLRERYGVTGEVMYPNRSEFTTPRPVEASRSLKVPGRLTLGYAGGLNYGYGPRLIELAPIFRETGTIVNVYGGNLPPSDNSDVLVSMGRASSPELMWERVKNECDAVILPCCFSNHGHQVLYQTHFPSKLSEYLALGMPVLISGPVFATGIKWGLQNRDSCLVITEQSGPQWSLELARLRDDSNFREELASNAICAGNRDFEPTAIRAHFRDTILKVANYSRNSTVWASGL